MSEPHPYTILSGLQAPEYRPGASWLRDGGRLALNVAKHTRNVIAMWRAFDAFLDRGVGSPGPRGASPTLVVVQPWQGSAMAWQMVATALLLWRRDANVIVVWDDSVMNWRDVGEYVEHWCIKRILARLPMRTVKLGDYADRSTTLDVDPHVARLARLNAIKVYQGEAWSAKQERYAQQIRRPLKRAMTAADALFGELAPKLVVTAGGIFSTSGVHPIVGAARGIRVASLDPSPTINLVSVDGIAAHMMDVARAVELLGPLPAWAKDLAVADWQRRTKGTDQFRSQVVQRSSSEGAARDGVLIPLNQSHDTAALGRSRLFEGQDDWMMQTVAWLLENTRANITLRQHPADRMIAHGDDYVGRFGAQLRDNPRVRFIAATDAVNTYDLIARSQVVLPYVSTVGIESVTMGTPVVQEANAYYRDQGFVRTGDTKPEYFRAIAAVLADAQPVSDEHRERAWRAYYLSQICSFVPTTFTAYFTDFAKWATGTLDEVAAMPDVQDLVDAVERGIPLCYLRHQRLARERQQA